MLTDLEQKRNEKKCFLYTTKKRKKLSQHKIKKSICHYHLPQNSRETIKFQTAYLHISVSFRILILIVWEFRRNERKQIVDFQQLNITGICFVIKIKIYFSILFSQIMQSIQLLHIFTMTSVFVDLQKIATLKIFPTEIATKLFVSLSNVTIQRDFS